MTGTIFEVTGKGPAFCKIKGEDGKTYFAHREVFADPSQMKMDEKVTFNLKPFHPVTDVVAIPSQFSTPSLASK